MDDRLKQRLLGAAAIVALVVIFVPMLFDERPDQRAGITATNIPPLPTEIEEREIALPSMPAETQPSAGGPDKERAGASYRIIPLTDGREPAAEAAPATNAGRASADGAQRIEDNPVEFGEDEGAEESAELPTRDSPLGRATRSAAGASADSAKSPSTPAGAASTPRKPPVAQTHQGDQARPSRPETAAPAKAPAAAVSKHPATAATPPKSAPTAAAPKAAVATTPAKQPSGNVSKTATAGGEKAQQKPVNATAKPPASTKSPPAKADEAKAEKKSEPTPTPKSVAAVKSASEPAQASKALPPKSAGAAAPKPATATAPQKKTEAPVKTAAASPPAEKAAATPKSQDSATSKSSSEAVTKPKVEARPAVWVIQAGSFTAEKDARVLADKLRKNKFAAFVETVPGQKGATYRVQVGPELEKSRAEQVQKRLESSSGIRGIVTSHR